MDERAVAKAIYLGEADDQINDNAGKLDESEGFTQHVIHQFIQTPSVTVRITRLVNQRVEIAGTRES